MEGLLTDAGVLLLGSQLTGLHSPSKASPAKTPSQSAWAQRSKDSQRGHRAQELDALSCVGAGLEEADTLQM